MKINLKQPITCAALAGLVCICAETFAAETYPKAENGVKIICRIYDQVVRSNGVARFILAAESDEESPTTNDLVYRWHKNSNPLSDSGLGATNSIILGVTNSILTISNVQRSDVGFYTCYVSKVKDGKKGKPVVVYGRNVDATDPDKAPARLFVLTGTNTVIHGPYGSGNGSAQGIGSYIGKTVFPRPTPPPYTPGESWHSRPYLTTKVKIDDVTLGATGNGGTAFTTKVQIWESTGLANLSNFDNVQYNNVGNPSQGFYYKFTTYIMSGTAPQILDLDINWNP